MTKKLHIALLFGGNSSEHDVSKRSAHNIYDALDKEKYDVSLFMFTKDGILLGNEDSQKIFDGEPEDQVVAEAYQKMDMSSPLAPIINKKGRYILQTAGLIKRELTELHLVIPMVHGKGTEDGTIQGLFKLLNKPYVGSNIAASAMSFDKDLTKKIISQAGIRNTPYVVVTPENRADYSWGRIEEKLGNLTFVKPAKQGSSVGIHRVTNAEEYEKALDDAFKYDYKILVEQGIANPQEIEISILGNEHPIASKLGAVRVPKDDPFYDYENKFVDASGVVFELPVKLPQYLVDEITDMALKAYKALGMKGMARIDFLVDSNNVPYLGEPNTLPGFTNISLYPQMWEVSGISYSDLIDRLIQLGLQEFERNSKIKYDFRKLGTERVGQKKYNED